MSGSVARAILPAISSLALCLLVGAIGCNDDKTVTGGDSDTGVWNTRYVRDFHYARGRVFDLGYPGEIGRYDSVDLLVFEEEVRADNPESYEVVLKVSDSPEDDEWIESPVRVIEVSSDDYRLAYVQDGLRSPIALVLYNSLYRAVGVYMRVFRFDESHSLERIDTVGYVGDGIDTLRMLQPPGDPNPDHPTWQLAWRNCYGIPRGIGAEDIQIDVYMGLLHQEGTANCLNYQVVDKVAGDRYLQILGLDQWNSVNGNKEPDGRFDYTSSVFRPDWGLMVFPEHEPFNSDRLFYDEEGNASDGLVLRLPNLYNYRSTAESRENSSYYIEVRYRTYPD